jgi:type I restriction enzyme M protein
MADYLQDIAKAKAEIARVKGEKEAFEQSNVPDDLEEEEAAKWNYAKELANRMRQLKGENKEALKQLGKLVRAAEKKKATDDEKRAVAHARANLQSVFDELAQIEQALEPYDEIKEQLGAARARYRTLTVQFVNELKSRCAAMDDEGKRALVLELFAQDVETRLDAVVAENRQELVRLVEGLWDKYRVTLTDLRSQRTTVEEILQQTFAELGYQ